LDVPEIIQEANAKKISYHKLIFPDGTILNGIWDMSKYLNYYKIPQDLSGKTVLDVGAKTGYFSFEFAKRGARKVIALDNYPDAIREAVIPLMNTNVEVVIKDLFDLDESFGKFDLVFCSSVLIHVSDMFAAIKKLREVTKEQVIISTIIRNDSKYDGIPLAYFEGIEKKGRIKTYSVDDIKAQKTGKFWSYWMPNFECLIQMMKAAGFNRVEKISDFHATSEDGNAKIVLGVVHGFV